MSTTTNKHRAAFTLALRSVSPSLSALHASRLRLIPPNERERALGPDRPQPPPLTTLTCVQCGHAPVRVRVVRLGAGNGKNKAKAKAKAKTKQITPNTTHGNNNQEKHPQTSTSTKVVDDHATRNDPSQRVIDRTCMTCAFVERILISRGAAASFRSTSSSCGRKARRVARSRTGDTRTAPATGNDSSSGRATPSLGLSDLPATTPRPVIAPVSAHTPPAGRHTPTVPDPAPKKRPKKKSGLQELLERNRQRQDAAARAKASSGLSSFLDGL